MRVIPAFDPFEDRQLGFCLALEAPAMESLPFQGGEEALRHRVIVGIPDGSHRGHDAGFAAALAESIAGVLGEFKRSWQHLQIGGVIWDGQGVGLRSTPDGRRWCHLEGRVSISAKPNRHSGHAL